MHPVWRIHMFEGSLETICLCKAIRDLRTTSNNAVDLEVLDCMCVCVWQQEECGIHFCGLSLSWCLSVKVEPVCVCVCRVCVHMDTQDFSRSFQESRCTVVSWHTNAHTREYTDMQVHHLILHHRDCKEKGCMQTNIQIGRLKTAVWASRPERLKLFGQMKTKKTTTGKCTSTQICKH